MRSLLFAVLLALSAVIPAFHSTMNSNSCLYAQEKKIVKTETLKKQNDNKIFKVMIIVMVIWLGIGGYLFSIDRKVKKLEKDINEL